MSFRVFLRQCIMQFFIITAFANVVSAVFGPILLPDQTLNFNAFYSPLIAGVLGTLPSVILYSRRELNLRQTIARKILHLLALEIVLTGVAWFVGNVSDLLGVLLFAFMVFIVYVAVSLVSWALENRDAKKINAGLKSLQGRQ